MFKFDLEFMLVLVPLKYKGVRSRFGIRVDDKKATETGATQ